jgi:hypothetical protein
MQKFPDLIVNFVIKIGMTKNKPVDGNVNNIFSKDMAYRFSTLLVVAGCYPIEGFVITGAKVINYLRINQIIILK